MSNVTEFHGVPASRRHLARQLRELASIIEADKAETEPHGILMCLMGAAQFEVVTIGQSEGWLGATQAMKAVVGARFDTIGGNIRMRHHSIYEPRPAAEVTPLALSIKAETKDT